MFQQHDLDWINEEYESIKGKQFDVEVLADILYSIYNNDKKESLAKLHIKLELFRNSSEGYYLRMIDTEGLRMEILIDDYDVGSIH